MSIRSTFRRKEAKKKPAKKQTPSRFSAGRLFLFGFLVFGLYVGVGFLLTIPAFTVDTITLSENSVLVSSDIVPIVEEEIASKSLWPYKRDSIFLVPKKRIREQLHQEFSRLASVSIKKEGLKEVVVKVHEKEGEYMWCGGVDMLINHSRCYMIDAKGQLFDIAPEVSGDAYFKIFGGEVSDENPIGQAAFSLDDFNTVVKIRGDLERYDIDTVALLIGEDGLLEFIKKTEGKGLYDGARIKFTLLVDYLTSVNNLFSALESEPLKTEFAEKVELLQYIDVRFDNRVYYKFND